MTTNRDAKATLEQASQAAHQLGQEYGELVGDFITKFYIYNIKDSDIPEEEQRKKITEWCQNTVLPTLDKVANFNKIINDPKHSIEYRSMYKAKFLYGLAMKTDMSYATFLALALKIDNRITSQIIASFSATPSKVINPKLSIFNPDKIDDMTNIDKRFKKFQTGSKILNDLLLKYLENLTGLRDLHKEVKSTGESSHKKVQKKAPR